MEIRGSEGSGGPSSTSVPARLRRLAKRVLAGPARREVAVRVGDFLLVMDPINPLAQEFQHNPGYSSALGRLTAEVVRKYPEAAVLDVGANVGDTAAIVKSAADVPVVCVEGDPGCVPFLTRNVRQFRDVTVHEVFLDERTGPAVVSLEKQGWNTTIIPGDGPASVMFVALDDLMASIPTADRIKLVKIDTEGFDTRILRGARRLIATNRPALYFEYNRHAMLGSGEDGFAALTGLCEQGYDSVLFYEATGRFVLASSLGETGLMRDLHEYCAANRGLVRYFDVCVFHDTDRDVAEAFIARERRHRDTSA